MGMWTPGWIWMRSWPNGGLTPRRFPRLSSCEHWSSVASGGIVMGNCLRSVTELGSVHLLGALAYLVGARFGRTVLFIQPLTPDVAPVDDFAIHQCIEK